MVRRLRPIRPRPNAIALLAGEAPVAICRRIEDIHASLQSPEGTGNIEVYPHPDKNVGKLNLEREQDWQAVEAETDKADMIVIDHLTAWTVGNNSTESWHRLHLLLRQHTKKGKTILLLHHAGKSGQQRGTSTLDADIDQKIHLTALADAANGAQVAFEKHRDDETLGKALQPFKLSWDKGDDGRLFWVAVDAEPAKTNNWVPLEKTINEGKLCVNDDFIQNNFNGREADVIRFLAKAIQKGNTGGLERVKIDEHLEVSASTTRPVINALVGEGRIVSEGNGKATRYRLSDETRSSIFHA